MNIVPDCHCFFVIKFIDILTFKCKIEVDILSEFQSSTKRYIMDGSPYQLWLGVFGTQHPCCCFGKQHITSPPTHPLSATCEVYVV